MTNKSLGLFSRLLLLVLLLVGCDSQAQAQRLELTRYAEGLAQPTTITHARDGSGRLFVTEKTGRIRIVADGQTLPTAFLDLSEQVSTNSERGLLGLAFHPNYSENGTFFVNYTNRAGDTVIARFMVSDDANRADLASETVLLTIEQPYANHNGGQLAFGADGYLYIGTGDGGSGGDPLNAGQRLDTLLGKILRIDVDGGEPYAVPADNPLVNTAGAEPEIWAYGLRNPWRFSFDRETGDLWIADVGQNALEEVNFQPANSPGGENYGWRLMEASACFNPNQNCNDGTLVLPVLEYSHASGAGRSITGGYVYRGSAIPSLVGTYLYADFVSGHLFAATQGADGNWTAQEVSRTGVSPAAFGEDEAGELYLSDFRSGRLYRFSQP